MPSMWVAALVSATMTGTPLTKNMMSVRMSGGVPLVNVNSSVTWKVLASTCAGSSSRMFRSRFSASTKTVFSPLRYSQASRLPSMFGRTRTSRLSDVLGSQVIHDAGVEPLELIDENGIEDRAGHPAPQVHGLLGREVGPAGVDRVADEGFLNRPFLAAEGGGDNAGRVIRRLGSGSGFRLSFHLEPTIPQVVPSVWPRGKMPALPPASSLSWL